MVIAVGMRSSATFSTSSMREAGTISSCDFDLVADLGQVLDVLLGDHDRLDAGPERRQQLLLQAADRQHAARAA